MTTVIRKRKTPYYPVFRSFHMENRPDYRKNFTPLNIIENDHVYKIELNVAGWSKEEIEIRIEEDTLIIRGEKEKTESEANDQYHVREFSNHKFYRSVILSDGVDQENIQAELKNGILLIELTKVKATEAELSRTIEIN